MKLCALSPFCSSSKSDILDFLRESHFDLIVLPGASNNTPSPRHVQRVIRPGVRVFVEHRREGKGKNIPCLVTNNKIVQMPRQVFARNPTAKEMDKLATAWPDRTFSLGSRRVSFLICGEINGFNPDGTVKHERPLAYDIIANPTHTIMGRWQHLGKKLERLSRGSIALHTANNDRNHHRIKTDVRIYKASKLVAQRRSDGTLTWSECEI